MIHMMLSDNIRKLRKQRQLSQEQLAEAMGVSTASVSKWENSQCAPELTMLMELADYFGVSVDSLLGHEVTGSRKEKLLLQMDTLINKELMEEATEIAEKLLQCYPNDIDVIRNVSDFYYIVFSKTRSKSVVHKSIELTKRLLILETDSTGARRFELLSQLGNLYALLEDYTQSRKYYTEGNVGEMNDAALAQLLTKEKRFEEATVALSDIFFKNLYNMITCILQLAECWEQLNCPQKATAALQYGIACLDVFHEEGAVNLTALKTNLYIELACYAEKRNHLEQADLYIKKAIHNVYNLKSSDASGFCVFNGNNQLIGSIFVNAEEILKYLQSKNEERLYDIAKEEVK